ncbi:MAG: N-acetyltransferase, partial [Alphaproteobacteria bacterium]
MKGGLEVGPIHPLHPDALQMIGESEAELAALYPPEVCFAFSPQELVEAGVHFLLARREARPVGCGGVAPLDGYGELKRMFVTKRARGTGVAQS